MAFNFVKIVPIFVILVILCQTEALPQTRIVNGNPASTNQFPWHVLINSTIIAHSHRYCGGSLIAMNFVLTAATCIENASTIKVHVGIISFFTPTETQDSSAYRLHPDFDYENGLNDIAIIKLDRNFTYRDNVRSIMLPGKSQVNNSFVYQPCNFSGFGMNNKSENAMSLYLLYSDNVVISNDYCKENLNRDHVDMCAVSYESSVCNGDQGGALVFYDAGKFYQIGLLTSINPGGCNNGNPHVYAKVTKYLDWITYLTGLYFDY